MNKPISRKGHGIAEWSYIPLTALAPEIMKFSADKKASSIARIMSGVMLGSAMLTKAEWGVFKVLPFRFHLAADAGVSAFSLAAPWLFKFAQHARARNTFLFIGLTGLLIGGLLTQRREM